MTGKQDKLGDYLLDRAAFEHGPFRFIHGRDATSGVPVLIKTTVEDHAAAGGHALDREFEFLSAHETLTRTVALRPLRRVYHEHATYAVFERFPGAPLLTLSAEQPAASMVELSRHLCRALATIHERGLVHGRLDGRAVLWDGSTGELRLMNFHATSPPGSDLLKVPLAELSPEVAPEQTGRTNLEVDQRADLYALGVLLFRLSCGRPPIDWPGPREGQHAVLTEAPASIRAHRPELSAQWERLILDLLAKEPSDRPANTSAVLSRLDALDESDSMAEAPPFFTEPRSVCGRDAEFRMLSELTRAVARGRAMTLLVEGAAGSGKSRLVDTFARQTSLEWRFVAGKFDQFQRGVPYSALVAALRGHVERLLTEPASAVDRVRARCSTIDDGMRATLVSAIPDLARLLGDSNGPPALGIAEAHNRFLNAFDILLTVLQDPQRPTLLFLDDVQWADPATINILLELFLERERGPGLLVLAHRPLIAAERPWVDGALERFRGADSTRALALHPLSAAETEALCNSVCPCVNLKTLAACVHRRSQGNPLFAVATLQVFRQQGVLEPLGDPAEGPAWRFVEARAAELAPATDSVIDVILERLSRVPPRLGALLEVASCIGHEFELELLSQVFARPTRTIHEELSQVLDAGLVMPVSGSDAHARPPSFRFVHDRIQQAIHAALSDQQRVEYDLRLGRAMLADERSLDERSFRAAEHLWRSRSELNPAEKDRLAQLSLLAGQRARDSVAYEVAVRHLGRAFELASEDGEPVGAIRMELAECLYLSSEFEAADEHFETLLDSANTNIARAAVLRSRMTLYLHMQRYHEAIVVGRRALRFLGVRLPGRAAALRIPAKFARVRLAMGGRTPGQLAAGDSEPSEAHAMALEILILLWTPCFWIDQPLSIVVGLELMQLTLTGGFTPESPMAFVCHGILRHLGLGQYEVGIEFGLEAERMLRPGASPFVGDRVRFLSLTFFGPFLRENRRNVEAYELALAKCIDHGEHVFAACCLDGITTSVPIAGFRLSDARARLEACRSSARRVGSAPSGALASVVIAWCDQLSGSADPDAMAGQTAVEALEHEAYSGFARLLEMVTNYLWGNDELVQRLSKQLRFNLIVQSNPLHNALYELFSHLASCRRAGRSSQRRLRRLRRLSELYPQNFDAMFSLARAEAHRTRGEVEHSNQCYRRAVELAASHDHYLVHAVACERLATFHEVRGDREGFVHELRVTAASYDRWGAMAKVEQLARAYPSIDLRTRPRNLGVDLASQVLDIDAMMAASRAIAQEVEPEKLVATALRVAVQIGGAQSGALLRPQDDDWSLAGTHPPSPDAQPRALSDALLPNTIIQYVAQSERELRVVDPSEDGRFEDDPYLLSVRPRVVYCAPLAHRGQLLGLLYLENRVSSSVLTPSQCRVVAMLGRLSAIALGNADFHKVQLEALQAKIRPHFLFNVLTGVAELVLEDQDSAERAVVKLAHLYRYMLTSTVDQVVTLEDELRITKSYLDLEKIRFGDRLDYVVDVIGDPSRVWLPALVLQPLAENAVRHGISDKPEGGKIAVRVEIRDDVCELIVQDDGVGWQGQSRGTGVGLRSIHDRLALHFGAGSSPEIEDNDGVTVRLRIPTGPAPGR